MNTIVILSDGETWSDISGCTVADLDPEEVEELESGAEPNQIGPLRQVHICSLLSIVDELSRLDEQEGASELNHLIRKAGVLIRSLRPAADLEITVEGGVVQSVKSNAGKLVVSITDLDNQSRETIGAE